MKIALCLKDNRLDSELDNRFGRAEYFAIVDGESGKELEIMENTAKNEPSGAGSRAVQLLVNSGAEVIIGPEFGPKAFDALNQFNLKLYRQGSCTKVSQALEEWKSGKLDSPGAPGHGGGLHKA